MEIDALVAEIQSETKKAIRANELWTERAARCIAKTAFLSAKIAALSDIISRRMEKGTLQLVRLTTWLAALTCALLITAIAEIVLILTMPHK